MQTKMQFLNYNVIMEHPARKSNIYFGSGQIRTQEG